MGRGNKADYCISPALPHFFLKTLIRVLSSPAALYPSDAVLINFFLLTLGIFNCDKFDESHEQSGVFATPPSPLSPSIIQDI